MLVSEENVGISVIKNFQIKMTKFFQNQIPIVEDKEAKTAIVTGIGGPIDSTKEELFLGEFIAGIFLDFFHMFFASGNAGTAMRPLAGVLCAGRGTFILDGVSRMRERPIIDLVDALQQVAGLYLSYRVSDYLLISNTFLCR